MLGVTDRSELEELLGVLSEGLVDVVLLFLDSLLALLPRLHVRNAPHLLQLVWKGVRGVMSVWKSVRGVMRVWRGGFYWE